MLLYDGFRRQRKCRSKDFKTFILPYQTIHYVSLNIVNDIMSY